MKSVSLFIVVGLVLSMFAALAAFLITYEEWTHHYASGSEPLKHGIRAAVIAFLVFAVLTVLAGAIVSQLD